MEQGSAFVLGEDKRALPPITMLLRDFPTLDLFLGGDDSTESDVPADPPAGESKTPQYTLHDDLKILETIKSYYGSAFRGRVPWSFWQTFRKVTGNERSSSSLYHHWNGAMKRKYGAYLMHGRIDECLAWIERALATGKPIQRKAMEVTGSPMMHNWSLPPAPIQGVLPCQPLQRQNSSRD